MYEAKIPYALEVEVFVYRTWDLLKEVPGIAGFVPDTCGSLGCTFHKGNNT